ncbi:pentapeptide repeat-containing protein [Paenibacillus glacialis]|uniref:Pentapeptide repeat-containing protein n=1 Tax=Paenibacillus glacialis TaxID=494026 RepID=A0A168KJP8_9BACL|nr:pentapeptide repeat-containing protein [Paenibacillus glacialis]OAB42112.1 hypothetical protein PGLA_13665 [Paenibacillus glacialis]
MTAYNKEEIIHQLESHQLWIDTLGKEGNKLGFDEVDFCNIDIDLIKYPLDQAYLTACTFDGMNLYGKDMHSSLICSSTFITTNLENADFYKADVSYVDFTNANVKNARYAKSDCSEAIFIKADLTNAKLISCSLYLTDFREATLKNVDVSSSSFKGVLLKGAKLSGIKGLEDAFIKSINIGTPEIPILIEGEEAVQWIINNCSTDEQI